MRVLLASLLVLGAAMASGKTDDPEHFWFNSVTGASQWERPTALGHEDPGHPGHTFFTDPYSGEATWDKPKEAAWVHTTVPVGAEHAGAEFFFNENTKESTWERPAALGWSKKATRAFWHNEITGETTWETPAEVGHIDEATGRRFWVDRKGKSIWEPPKAMAWEEVIIPEGEPHAGYKYYHNSVSEETTWERPQALQWTQVHPEF